jgi:hypothetical protein
MLVTMKECRPSWGSVLRWGSPEALRRAYTILGIACLLHMAISQRAAGQPLPQKAGLVVKCASSRGCVPIIVSNVSEGRKLRFEMNTLRDATAQEELTLTDSEKKSVQFAKVKGQQRSLWVQIVGGFGLFFWVQRFRN